MNHGDHRSSEPLVGSRRGGGRRPFVVGIAVSAGLHVLLIALYPFFGAAVRDGVFPGFLPEAADPSGTQVVQLVELAPDETGEPDTPVETIEPEAPEAEPEELDLSDGRPRFPERYRSTADRLRAGQGDPRLWGSLDPSVGEPTPEEVARLRMLTALESMNDSALAEFERQAQFTDWTYTDDDGNRWGVSPGRLHLGKVSIPMPFGFGPPPDYNGDQAARAFMLQDIDRAASTRAVREMWKERIEAMRERREQRRAQEEEEEDPTKRVVRPDTTGVGRSR
ncbi:MAG: hypothetical protein OEO23_03225 [Gemmatimonadota bacterium]|nr:hypothetical protein [Gemmatimonadota bacterium]